MGALLLLVLCKGLAYSFALSCFRGGPVFPGMFIGAAGGIALSHLPGLPMIDGAAMGIGAMTVAMLGLPLVSVLLVALFLAGGRRAVDAARDRRRRRLVRRLGSTRAGPAATGGGGILTQPDGARLAPRRFDRVRTRDDDDRLRREARLDADAAAPRARARPRDWLVATVSLLVAAWIVPGADVKSFGARSSPRP